MRHTHKPILSSVINSKNIQPPAILFPENDEKKEALLWKIIHDKDEEIKAWIELVNYHKYRIKNCLLKQSKEEKKKECDLLRSIMDINLQISKSNEDLIDYLQSKVRFREGKFLTVVK